MTCCCVIGLGYIGLPTAALLSRAGHHVIGVDIDPHVVETVNQGLIHIVEPDLALAVRTAVDSGRLRAQTVPEPADVFLIAVPTPFQTGPNGKPSPNVDFVMSAARSISSVLCPGNLVLLESTSPVGTTQKVASLLSMLSGIPASDINVAYCPERVLPGRILQELVTNDRVIGALSDSSLRASKEFYGTFCSGALLETSASTAEFVKLAENSFRDVNIAFANELSMVCDRLSINVLELIKLANHHPRVNILRPGCGVGGHCIAVDPWFLASSAPDITPLIQSARAVNDRKSRWVIDKIHSHAQLLTQELGRPPVIGCMGLSFKPDVDDLRESPALFITSSLLSAGLDILVCEPNLSNHPTIELHTANQLIREADLLVILVGHSQFKYLNLSSHRVLDFCGLTDT